MQGNIPLKGIKTTDISWSDMKGLKILTHETFLIVITQWKKLLDFDWVRDGEFIRNLRTISVIRGKLHISRTKSVINSECKY